MRIFRIFVLVSLFFFMIACDDGVQRFIPVDEIDDGSSEIADDSDSTDTTPADDDPADSTDTTPGDDDPADSTDTTPADNDPADSTDTTPGDDDPADSTDTTPDDDADSGDTTPVDDDSTDTTPVDDDQIIPDSGEAKCAAASEATMETIWDASSQSCYRIETCGNKPENSEWNGDSSYKVYYDVNTETWMPAAYSTQYGDGEPQPCQYKCIEKYGYEGGECKPYCSAVFNGTDSKIEVPSNTALNLASETWTIEAWIKQAAGDINSSNLPIVRKGTGATPVYVLTGYKKSGTTTHSVLGYVSYSYVTSGMPSQSGNGTLTPTGNVTYSADWTHVALVQNKETSGDNQWTQTTTYKLLLFLNGEQIASEEYKASNTSGGTIISNKTVIPTIKTNNEALVIGAHVGTDPGLYFKGLIDSIKISNTAKYTAAFTPAALSVDDTTVAFWDFSGDATSSVGSGLDGAETEITYSTDCK
ncbi:hypothetical protein J5681_07115 [bacterium]|nr:hypothetical protein [bacterium]